MSKDYWDLRSCWSLRRPRYPLDEFVMYLLEHEVVVSGGPPHMEIVARFVHALSDPRSRGRYVVRGGLVGLTIRKRRDAKKKIGDLRRAKLATRSKRHPT